MSIKIDKDRTPRTGKYMPVRRSVSVKLKYIHSSLTLRILMTWWKFSLVMPRPFRAPCELYIFLVRGGGLKCRNGKCGNVEIFASKTIVNMILIDVATSL